MNSEMNPEIAWTYPVAVAELPEDGAEFRLEPDNVTRASLAKFAGVLAVPHLIALFKVTPSAGGGAVVEGSLDATVTQECGVTLDPFDNTVSERVSIRFVPEGGALDDPSGDDPDADVPDELINGALDLALVATEFLVLGIDPYPRKPGAVFQPPEEDGKSSAFAVLEQLKRGKSKEND